MGKRLFNILRAKVASIDGETLVETLVSTLIMALVMLMLCTAIVSAAKVNASADEANSSFNQASTAVGDDPAATRPLELNVTITHSQNLGGGSDTLSTENNDIKAYTQNGYVCYEPVSRN